MDQQKRGQRRHGAQHDQSRTRHEGRMHGDRSSQQDRDPAEGSRENVNTGRDPRQQGGERGSSRTDERGMGSSGERHSGGISNRGMDRSMEQRDLPGRGSTRDSER